MSKFNHWQSGTALMMVLGLTAGAAAPIVAPAPAFAQSRFTDVPANHWARGFIEALAERNIIAGFLDNSFRPDEPVTRAQFAAMVRKAFNQSARRPAVAFVDVPADYWATPAIEEAYTTGFMSGYPGNVFRPNQNIPRVQALVSLASGLNYSASNNTAVAFYSDAADIPEYAVSGIAAATEKQLVVNFPALQYLNPNQLATRADVAAFIYQALVSQEQVAAIESPYIVGKVAEPPETQLAIPAGTTIPTVYAAEKILVLPDETAFLNLTIQQNITSESGKLLIPAGSFVSGNLTPVEGGSQFVAEQLIFPNEKRLDIDATSQVLTETETIRRGASATTILAGAVLGSGAATAIAGVTGDRRIEALEILAGTAAGTLASVFLGRRSVKVVSIDPNTDLNLRLGSALVLPDD